MHRRLVLTVSLSLVVASCATSGGASPAVIDDPVSSSISPTTVGPESTPDGTPDVAAFIAAVNEAVIGTSYEDAARVIPKSLWESDSSSAS